MWLDPLRLCTHTHTPNTRKGTTDDGTSRRRLLVYSFAVVWAIKSQSNRLLYIKSLSLSMDTLRRRIFVGFFRLSWNDAVGTGNHRAATPTWPDARATIANPTLGRVHTSWPVDCVSTQALIIYTSWFDHRTRMVDGLYLWAIIAWSAWKCVRALGCQAYRVSCTNNKIHRMIARVYVHTHEGLCGAVVGSMDQGPRCNVKLIRFLSVIYFKYIS